MISNDKKFDAEITTLRECPNFKNMAKLSENMEEYYQNRNKIIDAYLRFKYGNLQRVKPKTVLSIPALCKEAGINRSIMWRKAYTDLRQFIIVDAKNAQVYVRKRIVAAIERIRAGKPQVIKLDEHLSLSSYAREAGVSIAASSQKNCLDLQEIIKKDIEKINPSRKQKLLHALERLKNNIPIRLPKDTPITCENCCKEAGISKRWTQHPDFIDINKLLKAEVKKYRIAKRSEFLFEVIAKIKNNHATKLLSNSNLTLTNLIKEAQMKYATIHNHHPEILEAIRKHNQRSTEDVWRYESFGLVNNSYGYKYSLSFRDITQLWLKEAVKKYTSIYLYSLSPSTLNARVVHLKNFSKFLRLEYQNIAAYELDRKVIEQYLQFIGKHKDAYCQDLLITLRHFLEICKTEKLLNIKDSAKIYETDIPKIIKRKPRYIPDCVMQQLYRHIDKLPPIEKRFVLILAHCGMRVSELSGLAFDCLVEDNSGDFFLKYTQFKQMKEHIIPISPEIVSIIKDQQKVVIDTFGRHGLLFPAPKVFGRDWHRIGKPLAPAVIAGHLNKLAKIHNIYDENGKIWHFQTHQFRHTVGTRMINNGVPQHIVQKYLGHDSPDMTSVYAHIFDSTMKEEFAKFQSKFVNIAGDMVKMENVITKISDGLDVNEIDAQWMKKNILSQTLPNGLCALPIVQKKCPHANACLTCSHFRTDLRHLQILKSQLAKTNKLIQNAKINGWIRQVETNQLVANNLKNIIISLEKPL